VDPGRGDAENEREKNTLLVVVVVVVYDWMSFFPHSVGGCERERERERDGVGTRTVFHQKISFVGVLCVECAVDFAIVLVCL